MALPSIIVVLVATGLMYPLGARLLSSKLYGAAAAAFFASTPLVWLAARAGSEALYQLPIVIGWLVCIDRFRSEPRPLHLAAAGGLLALGLYTHPAAIVTMPVLLALSVVTLTALGGLPVSDRRLGAMLAAFVALAIPFAVYLALHPEHLHDRIMAHGLYDADRYNMLQGLREMFSWVGLTARTEVYYDSFNPALLFLSGGGIVKSITNPQVFLPPFAVVLALGFHRILTHDSPPAAWLAVGGFFAAPIAAALTAQPPVPARLLLMAPCAAIIAAYGLRHLMTGRRATRPREVMQIDGHQSAITGAV